MRLEQDAIRTRNQLPAIQSYHEESPFPVEAGIVRRGAGRPVLVLLRPRFALLSDLERIAAAVSSARWSSAAFSLLRILMSTIPSLTSVAALQFFSNSISSCAANDFGNAKTCSMFRSAPPCVRFIEPVSATSESKRTVFA